MSKIVKEFQLSDGRTISIETGKLAKQADGSVVVKMGDTMLLATVVAAKEAKEDVDFMPLTVEYREKYAAAGRFPGGFFKRETRPSDYEVLIARLVDRALRPLFPEDFHAEVQVIITLMSSDKNMLPDALACLAASSALAVSDVPFNGPISEVRVGRINGQFVVNPSISDLLTSDLLKVVPLSGFTVERLAGIRVFAMLCFPFTLVVLTRFSKTAIIMAPILAALGFMLPRVMAARNRNHYLEAVRGCLPHMADMLYAFVLGGKNLDQAFRGAADASPEPLESLLIQAVRELELGASREESFGRMLERCPLPELSSLLRSLIEAERRGYTVSTTLAVFSREIRLRRRDQLKVTVAKAPLKMLAPLVFLILPASVLLTVGPTFLVTLSKVF